MERYCSTGQSPQRAVAPTEEEEVFDGFKSPLFIRQHSGMHKIRNINTL